MTETHIPVLRNEILDFLNPNPNGVYLDATIGLGGHSYSILKTSVPTGRLIGIDIDESSLAIAKQRLYRFKDRFILKHGNFGELDSLLATCGIYEVDGVLFDLGVSSLQLDTSDRGFSFQHLGPLDMRMDLRLVTSAALIVNNCSPDQLIHIFKEYGEERYAKQIVRRIVQVRTEKPITTTLQLAEIVEQVYSKKPQHSRDSRKLKNKMKRIHPATRIFQALRIQVNGELNNLRRGLDAAVSVLKVGGNICAISFHSLEDRIVKQKFRHYASTCICPPKTPVCICTHEKTLEILTSKPVLPSQSEIDANPRSRSAKLRVASRV